MKAKRVDLEVVRGDPPAPVPWEPTPNRKKRRAQESKAKGALNSVRSKSFHPQNTRTTPR